MNFRMGMDVLGPDGKVGELSRLVVDPERDTIVGLVVRNGLLPSAEYVVPLECVRPTDADDLAVDFTEEGLREMQLFDPTKYGEPDPDYTGPPGWDATARGQENLAFESYVAMGPLVVLGGGGAPVLGFPGGEHRPAKELHWSSLQDGSDVFDSGGEKVGEVEAVAMEPDNGKPVSITVRQGWLFKKHVNVPAEWISDIGDGRVVLGKPKEELGRLAS